MIGRLPFSHFNTFEILQEVCSLKEICNRNKKPSCSDYFLKEHPGVKTTTGL